MNLPTYSTLQAEAAMCLWEAMLEGRDSLRVLDEVWQDVGTVQMRHFAIELSPYVCQVWDTLSEDERESCIPYDWEFVPALLKHIEWENHRPVLPETPRQMAELTLQTVTA